MGISMQRSPCVASHAMRTGRVYVCFAYVPFLVLVACIPVHAQGDPGLANALLDGLRRSCSYMNFGPRVMMRCDNTAVGEHQNVDKSIRTWNRQENIRIYEDETRIDVSLDRWDLRDGERHHDQWRHAFWNGKLAFNYQAYGQRESPAQQLAVTHSSEDQFRVLKEESTGAGLMRGRANFDDFMCERQWSEFFADAINSWKIEAVLEGEAVGSVIRFSQGLWDYEAHMVLREGTYDLAKIVGERKKAPQGDNRAFLRYEFSPLEYTEVGGRRIMSKAEFSDYAIFADGSTHRNVRTTTLSDIDFDPDITGLGLFEIDAPEGTLVDDFTFPGIKHIVHDKTLQPYVSAIATAKIAADVSAYKDQEGQAGDVQPPQAPAVKSVAAVASQIQDAPDPAAASPWRVYWLLLGIAVLAFTAWTVRLLIVRVG